MNDEKKPTMLTLEPRGELVFEGPFDRSVLKTLVITNPIKNQKVAFKLKTTTPTMFFVRPNVGVLNPEEKINVEIYMHPNDPEADQKQHKFLIQAALALGEITNLQEFWKMQTSANIWDVKLKCLRQAAGSAAGSPDSKQDCEAELDDLTESVAKLIKQVRVLEEERLAFKQEIDILRRPKHRGKHFFKFACCVFTIVAAILGALYGKHYL